MAVPNFVKVKVTNFKKYNPRNDVKRPSWFRVDNGLVTSSQFYCFSHAEFKAWIYILSQASEKNSETVSIFLDHVERLTKIKRKEMMSAIQKLSEFQVIEVDVTDTSRARNVDGTDSHATYVRTNVQDVHNTTPSFDFLPLYELYPKKVGKADGLAKCAEEIKTVEDFELLRKAIEKYSKYVKAMFWEPQYIKAFDSFMSVSRESGKPKWREWADDETGTTVAGVGGLSDEAQKQKLLNALGA